MARKKYSFGHEALGEIKEKAKEETSRFNGLVGLGEAEVGMKEQAKCFFERGGALGFCTRN